MVPLGQRAMPDKRADSPLSGRKSSDSWEISVDTFAMQAALTRSDSHRIRCRRYGYPYPGTLPAPFITAFKRCRTPPKRPVPFTQGADRFPAGPLRTVW